MQEERRMMQEERRALALAGLAVGRMLPDHTVARRFEWQTACTESWVLGKQLKDEAAGCEAGEGCALGERRQQKEQTQSAMVGCRVRGLADAGKTGILAQRAEGREIQEQMQRPQFEAHTRS